MRRHAPAFTAGEWRRLAGLYGVIALLHAWAGDSTSTTPSQFPALVGLGFVAYMFGLRHAFDADHIAAVDDTVRFMLQKGKRSLGIGFFFSLGHSTVVLALAIGIILARNDRQAGIARVRAHRAASSAPAYPATFLLLIGILNLVVLLDILKLWRQAKTGQHSHVHVEELLSQRGLINRLFGGRLQRLVNHSWQMYPLGILFGLGFDTASEVGLLAMTAGASAGDLPAGAVLSLPILFAAGMTAMDTTDGVLMTKAYDWAFVNPLRKLFYNITITTLSIAVALAIGTVELMQVAIRMLDLDGAFFDRVAALDFGILGYVIVGVFLAAWGVSALVWRFGRIEERYGHLHPAHAHEHVHDGGMSHSHKHFH